MCLFIGIHQTTPSQFHQLLGGCQRADNHLQSPLGHSLNVHVIGDPIYLSKKTRNHPACILPWFEASLPGTLQSSKINSQVLDPLIPSLSSFCAVLKPGVPCKKAKTLKLSLISLNSERLKITTDGGNSLTTWVHVEHQKGVKEAPTVGTKPGTSTSRKQIIREMWTCWQTEWIHFSNGVD